jgi:hypothetical protein
LRSLYDSSVTPNVYATCWAKSAPSSAVLETQSVAGAMGAMQRFVVEATQEEFGKIASGARRHKL